MSKKALSVSSLVMINVAIVCSIKNWPISAEFGLASIFYYALGALLLFLPVSLVSAELATGWPQNGGVYVWIKEALGERMGFLAIWLMWVENLVWYPTILSFLSGTLAYAFMPSLAENTTYTFVTTLLIFWGATFLNLRGMKVSSFISSFSVVFGTLIPGVIIIVMGLFWVLSGRPTYIDFTWHALVPDLSSFSKMSLLVGVILGYAGMEVSAIHANDVENPRRDYPLSMLYSVLIIIGLSTLGTLAIAAVVPQSKIALHAGGIEAIAIFLDNYNLGWTTPLVALLVALGAFGGVSSWLVGPPRGLLEAATSGDLPPSFHRTNDKGMPSFILLLQAVLVSFISLLFLFMPTVNSSFWMLISLATQLYLIMYIMLFASALILRYTKKDVERAYRIPFGNFGMWVTTLIGIGGSLFCFLLGFIPPSQLDIIHIEFYEYFLLVGIILFVVAPFIITAFQKPSWHKQ